MKWLEFCVFGPRDPEIFASKTFFRKGILSWGKKTIRKFFPGIFEKKFPQDRPSFIEIEKNQNNAQGEIYDPEFEEWLFGYLEKDWNSVYKEIGESGSLLGYLSGYLSGALKLPIETVDEMGIEDYDRALKYKLGFGLEDRTDLEKIIPKSHERELAAEYSKNHAADWIAIYQRDKDGNILNDSEGNPIRGGKPFEYLSQMYRDLITTAIAEGKTMEQLQSDMAYPDLFELVETGKISEDEYLKILNGDNSSLLTLRLNRNFRRFAWTETSMAFNAGRISALVEGGINYAIFTKGRRMM
ncbi:hypothetical protein [Leptospira santarosai]|uniref:hypothetical protein n=1 Tax=Leptospira santarosai TaxID=28183 RepID=UPI0024AFBF13|nr:hypothetical protein [Leptospira santarosai]MDI7166726.1 hypothetical protein [Leptospira santarosai]